MQRKNHFQIHFMSQCHPNTPVKRRKLQANITDEHKDTKILNTMLGNQIQQYVKKIKHHDQVRFIPGIQGLFNICKSISVINHIKKLKNKNHMIISIDSEKIFDKIRDSFTIKKKKAFSKLVLVTTHLSIVRVINDNPQLTSYSMLKSRKLSL